MNPLSKLLALGLLGSVFVVPYIASVRGVGLGTERNAKIAGVPADCPPELRNSVTGKCPKNHRSIYQRGIRNRGSGYGK